jgi:5-(carboxyamino)imidazole ribonucleotide synthase
VPVGGLTHIQRSMPVHPKVKALEVAQDRIAEKDFLGAAGIPTADYRAVDSQQELEAALLAFGGKGVLKTRRLGYDGKGQRRFNGDDPAGAFAALGAVPMVLEGLVPFEREISIIAARGSDGAFAAYDPAENVHENGILARSTVPAAISADVAEKARGYAAALLDKLDYVGVIGIEFFVLDDGRLIANEIAPRVHNSGHWTEAACAISQFEMHIRAVCGLPLGNTGRHSDCVMENLIGADVARAADLLAEPDTVLHLYGKAQTRPGRKMGHFTRISPRHTPPVA